MELSSPITVYWDLAACEPVSHELTRVCADILAVRPLMLQLYDPSPVLGEGVRAVLDQLKGQPIAVTLTLTAACMSSLTDMDMAGLGVKELLLVVGHPDVLRGSRFSASVGVSTPVTEGNWLYLPEIVACCHERGIQRLVLPMQRLYNGVKPFLLTQKEQNELNSALAAIGGTKELKLTIHDPFIWKAFNPGVPFPQGGCQAANTMIAISPAGGVFPCPTLPLQLGTLGEESLHEILSSSRKKDFRRRLLLYPDSCRECSAADECKGGCRGRSYVMHGSLDGIDDACR